MCGAPSHRAYPDPRPPATPRSESVETPPRSQVSRDARSPPPAHPADGDWCPGTRNFGAVASRRNLPLERRDPYLKLRNAGLEAERPIPGSGHRSVSVCFPLDRPWPRVTRKHNARCFRSRLRPRGRPHRQPLMLRQKMPHPRFHLRATRTRTPAQPPRRKTVLLTFCGQPGRDLIVPNPIPPQFRIVVVRFHVFVQRVPPRHPGRRKSARHQQEGRRRLERRSLRAFHFHNRPRSVTRHDISARCHARSCPSSNC